MQGSQDAKSLPFQQLFEMAEEKFNQMDYEEAEYFYSLAYHQKPHDDMIVLCFSHVLKKNDKSEDAKKLLLQSLKDNPDGTYKRYFELAEMEHGEKAIKTFEKGITAATQSLSNPFLSVAPEGEIKRDIAQAYASIAEICMTDFADIPFEKVENKCAEVLQKGKAIDPSCMDVCLQIANCCIEKDENEIAKNELLLIKTNILSEKEEYDDELVTQCAKLFMEIQLFQDSIDILEKLNESQNSNPETIYLLAFCAFNMNQYDLCKDYIGEYPEGQMIDEEVEEAMSELQQELMKKGIKLKTKKIENEDSEEGDEEWMDVDEDDEIQ